MNQNINSIPKADHNPLDNVADDGYVLIIADDNDGWCPFDPYDPTVGMEPLTLTSLLDSIEEFVFEAASRRENYKDAWNALTATNVVPIMQKRLWLVSEQLWRNPAVEEAFEELLPRWLDRMQAVASEVQLVIDSCRLSSEKGDVEKLRKADTSQQFAFTGANERNAELHEFEFAYRKMLNAALDRHVAKGSDVKMLYWTEDASESINQLRESKYKDNTFYVLHKEALPVSLRDHIAGDNCVALFVPEEWLENCRSYITYDAPSLATVPAAREYDSYVMELASGTIRLSAHELYWYFLRHRNRDVPVVFIGAQRCCLALHDFEFIPECLHMSAVLHPNTHAAVYGEEVRTLSIPLREKGWVDVRGSRVMTVERLVAFDSVFYDGALTDDPAKSTEIPC